VVKEHNVVILVVTIHIAYQAVINVQLRILANAHQFLVATHLALGLNSAVIPDAQAVHSAANFVLRSDVFLRDRCVVAQHVLRDNRVATLIVLVPLLPALQYVLLPNVLHRDRCVGTQHAHREKYVATLIVLVPLPTARMYVLILNALILQIHKVKKKRKRNKEERKEVGVYISFLYIVVIFFFKFFWYGEYP